MSDKFSFAPVAYVRSDDKREDLGALTHEEKKSRKVEIEVLPEFSQGLLDVETFSHLNLIWVFHKSTESHLLAHPPWDDKPHGVFATRSPHRPNALGLTIVKLEKREGNTLYVSGADMIDGTPILDIKPYTSSDVKENYDDGWLKEVRKWHSD